MTGIRLPIEQGTDAWLAARRQGVTATDIPVLLGVSPYRCEADLAEEKLGLVERSEPTMRMRIGTTVEPLIQRAYEEATGNRTTRFRGLYRHPSIAWALASPDYRVVGRRAAMEGKWTSSRTRFADGLPHDVEAQAVWQAAVLGVEFVDVAVLTPDGLLPPFEVPANPAMFEDLVSIAADFRRRLAAGGPFEESNESLKRRYPRDSGAEMTADAELAGWVRELVSLRAQRKDLVESEERIEAAIKSRMGEVALLRGDGFRVSWKRSKDGEATDWKALAEHLMASMPETDRAAVVGPFVTVREGARYFRVTTEKEDAS